jgi:TonB family protein
MIQQRKKRNSSKVNLIISSIFHGTLILVIFYFAAKEGMLGKKLKEITVTMVQKEKKPEPPKEKPPEPKVEQPKVEQPKMAVPPAKVETASTPPPSDSVPAVAPSAVSLPSFEFSDGAKEVQSISDPNGIYKALVEYTLRSRWKRPEDPAYDSNVAEVELTVDKSGQIRNSTWLKGSGEKKWDDSVKAALAQTTAISRPPPKGFPDKFVVRFDVATTEAVDAIQLSVR